MADPGRRRGLAARLLIAYAISFLALLGLFGYLVERSARSALLSEMTLGLEQQARGLASTGVSPQAMVGTLATAIDARLTVIAVGGEVLADSRSEAAAMDNHADRPEVAAALAGRTGTHRRVSATTGVPQLYVAVPTEDGGALRLSIPEEAVGDRLGRLRGGIVAAAAAAGAVGVGVVALVAGFIARPLTRLADTASSIAAGDLDRRPARSPVTEIDRLGASVGAMADEMGTRLRAALAERHTLEVVLDALPQGVMLVAASDAVVYANRSFAALVGPVPETVGRLAPFRVQEMVRAARREGVVEGDVEHRQPVQTLRVIATHFEGDGRVLVAVSDVTDRRRIDDVRRDFVANASHELKTPVAAMLASAETLQIALERDPSRAPGFAAQIEESARSLARMVTDLLDLSRLEGEPAPRRPVDVAAVAVEALDRMRALAAERSVEISSSLEEAQVSGSAQDLALAIRNLLDNAVRHTEAGGSVAVTVRVAEGEAVVTVSDTGSGIPQRDLPRIFERFYRVDTARARQTGGTGLGLAIVRHVAEAHGGAVEVESELGRGSTFRLRLPAVA